MAQAVESLPPSFLSRWKGSCGQYTHTRVKYYNCLYQSVYRSPSRYLVTTFCGSVNRFMVLIKQNRVPLKSNKKGIKLFRRVKFFLFLWGWVSSASNLPTKQESWLVQSNFITNVSRIRGMLSLNSEKTSETRWYVGLVKTAPALEDQGFAMWDKSGANSNWSRYVLNL